MIAGIDLRRQYDPAGSVLPFQWVIPIQTNEKTMNTQNKMLSVGLRLIMLCAAGAASPGHAQSYPVKPVRLVLGAPAGGGADVILRPVAQRLRNQAIIT